jgi:large subunit ribosomal protein L25
MNVHKLSATSRGQAKKAKQLRSEGYVPAVMYGEGFDSQALVLSAKDFAKIFQETGMSQIITLDFDGKEILALVHDIQRDPITSEATHVDFHRVSKDHKVSTTVPLVLDGTSSGVKDLGGMLLTSVREVEVQALPQDLPSAFHIDISILKEFGDEVKVSDLTVSEGVEMKTHGDVSIVSLQAPAKKEEVKEEETAQPEDGQEKKPEEGDTKEGPPAGQKA